MSVGRAQNIILFLNEIAVINNYKYKYNKNANHGNFQFTFFTGIILEKLIDVYKIYKFTI